MVVVDVAELRRLPGCVELYRAALALQDGDATATLQHAQQAIALSHPHDPLTAASAQAVAGLAHWRVGDLKAALDGYLACSEGLERLGHVADVLGCSITVADLQLSQGRLGDAAATYERGLRLGEQHRSPIDGRRTWPLRGTADMHVGLAQVSLERGDEAAAARQLELALELGDQFGLPQFPYRRRAVMASLRQVQGALAEAQQLLEEAQRLYVGDFLPNVRPLPAQKVRILVARGNLREAHRWAEAQGLSSTDELSSLTEYEHLTLARVLLGTYLRQCSEPARVRAEALLVRLLTAAEEGSRAASVLDVLVLLAVARHARGDLTGATRTLMQALTLAEPEGHVRVFAGEGQPVAELLRTVPAGVKPDYVRRLLAACDRARPSGDGAPPPPPAAASGASLEPIVVETLSARELEVMRLLDGDLSGPDIARHLVVSLHTVRTHTKSIYTKLGVSSRRAAVRRAHELGLLTSGWIQRR
jgi:LuxR family maltose regulon positive regulatory protein